MRGQKRFTTGGQKLSPDIFPSYKTHWDLWAERIKSSWNTHTWALNHTWGGGRIKERYFKDVKMWVPWKHFDQLVFFCWNINSIVTMKISSAGWIPASDLKEKWTPKDTNSFILSSLLHPDAGSPQDPKLILKKSYVKDINNIWMSGWCELDGVILYNSWLFFPF